MRFAPPKRLRIADRASGLNQISVRSYNERLVLSLLLQNKGISRLEIGQTTGLSAQTISVIVRSLEQEGLIAKGEAQRGRVGPPTIPISLNPDGAYSIGVSIGYRKTEVVIIDFVGRTLHYSSFHYERPILSDIHSLMLASVKDAIGLLPPALRNRVAGVGVSVPNDIDNWEMSGALAGRGMEGIGAELESLTGLQVFLQNDITAAAGGEGMFGVAKTMTDYLYFYLGARLHKRLILNHRIHNARPSDLGANAGFGVLQLENELIEDGISAEPLWADGSDWSHFKPTLDDWRERCCMQLQKTTESLLQFVDINAVVLSSFAPPTVVEGLCRDLSDRFPNMRILPSSIPIGAKAVGAASLPFDSRFMLH